MSNPLTPKCKNRLIPAVLLLLALFAALPGCPGPGWIAQGFAKKTDAIYEITDRPTVIVVDDPAGQFNNPVLKSVIASQAGFLLVQDKVVKNVISQDKVNALAGKDPAKFAKMPLDQMGRELGAVQVIHITVDEVDAGNLEVASQPRLMMRVKLLDVEKRQRLFPKATPAGVGDDASTSGYPVKVEFRFRQGGGETSGSTAVLLQKLAERAGRDAAWVFYKHTGRQPGEPYED